MDVLIITSPDHHRVQAEAADALGLVLGQRGKRVTRSLEDGADFAVLSLPLDEALERSTEWSDQSVRSFMLVEDAPSSLSTLPAAARRTRAARDDGKTFQVDHWVLTGSRGERSVWEFEHHCTPCRLDWAVSAEAPDLECWATRVVDDLGLAPRPRPGTTAPMPSRVAFPGRLSGSEASRFTYVFDAREIGLNSADIAPAVMPATGYDARGSGTDSTSSPSGSRRSRVVPIIAGALAAALALASALFIF
ncbi:MAG: hypothetical protein AAGD10_07170 [Myxococcota bacterium]